MAQIRSARSKRASSLAAKRRLLIAVVTCILGVFAFAYFRVISNLDGTNNEIRAAEQEQRSHSAQQSDEIANELVPAIPSVVEPLPQVTTKHTKQQVVCGAHKADTCEECPQGNGQGWCNGECAWCHQTDTCMPKTTLCTQCGRKGTGVFDCEAISQECLWCEERSDCIAANDFCTNSSVVCGEHSAPTCRQCPQGDGEIDCSGECAWCKPLGVCMMKATGCTATCELREKITCEDVSHKCSWCNNKSKCLPADKYCPRPLVWKPAEKESWFVEPTKSYDLTLSVILPCGHEYLFFERTIWSILDSTPADVLHEIIIVDDNSDPPLESIAEKTYAEVKYVRSNETLGLIKAKHVGSEVATGDIIVFFDCHVKPA